MIETINHGTRCRSFKLLIMSRKGRGDQSMNMPTSDVARLYSMESTAAVPVREGHSEPNDRPGTPSRSRLSCVPYGGPA